MLLTRELLFSLQSKLSVLVLNGDDVFLEAFDVAPKHLESFGVGSRRVIALERVNSCLELAVLVFEVFGPQQTVWRVWSRHCREKRGGGC